MPTKRAADVALAELALRGVMRLKIMATEVALAELAKKVNAS